MNVERLIERLTELYPEKKVFALDSVDSHLREDLAASYKSVGYDTMQDFLAAYGFEIISGDKVRELRSFVMYTPGNEPKVIASKVQSVLSRLEEYYPNHKIVGSLQNEHKKLAGNISGLYQWLGYEDIGEFLDAYGFEYVTKIGRRETDFDSVVDYLVEKYETAPKPKNMGILIHDNPDLRGTIKTMQNRAPELFGMSLKQYFEDLGLFVEKGESSSSGGAITKAPVGGKMQEAAQNALRKLYSDGAQGDHGTMEQLEAALEYFTVKQNKSGQIYIQSVQNCPARPHIPYGVNLVSDGAFAGCGLQALTLPETVSEIGKEAFLNCGALEELSIPDSVESIGKRAFAGCTALKELDLSKCMAKIAGDAFEEGAVKFKPGEGDEPTEFVYNLDKQRKILITGYNGHSEIIRIPEQINGVTVAGIAREVFAGMSFIREVSMPDTITELGAQAFAGCTRLRRARLSNGISRLYANTFNGCVDLEEVNIPDGVYELKANTFKDSMLRRLHIGSGLPSLNLRAFFSGSYDELGNHIHRGVLENLSVSDENEYLMAEGTMLLSRDGKILHAAMGSDLVYHIPDGVEVIGAGAFQGLRGLSDIRFPETLRAIGDSAFMNTSLRSVPFGAGLCSIGNRAFAYCEKLSSVLFSEGLETIGEAAFQGCPLISLHLPATLRNLGDYAFSFMERYRWGDSLVSLEIASENPWFRSENGGFYRLEEGKKLLMSVLAGSPASFEVSEGTTHIGSGVFQYQHNLKQVYFPESLIEIGDDAFRGCSDLVIAALPAGLRVIGERAFLDAAVASFNIPETVEKIGHGAFTAEEIVLSGDNPHFLTDDNMLYEKCQDGSLTALAFFSNAERYTLKANTGVIAAYAFRNASVRELLIPKSVVTVEENAFDGCSALIRLYMEQRDTTQWAVVYLPEPVGQFFFVDDSCRRQLMDCIRINGKGDLFDFIKYDSLFEGIGETKDRILIAISRLKSAVSLMPAYRSKYERYLRENPKEAIAHTVRYDDVDGCSILCSLDVVNASNVDNAILLATGQEKVSVAAFFMQHKNKTLPDFDAFADFNLEL